MIKTLLKVAGVALFLLTLFFTHSEGLWQIPSVDAFTPEYCWDCRSGDCVFYPAGSPAGACDWLPPTVELTASPTTVNYGDTTTLTWQVDDLPPKSTCTATGPWSWPSTWNGSGPSYPLTANSTFTLRCNQESGTLVKQASVSVNVIPPPISVTLDPFNPSTIVAGQSSTISFTSTGATSCSGTGLWSGNLGVTSATNHSTGVMNTPGTYNQSVTCTGPGGSATSVTRSLTVTAATPSEPTFSATCSLQANGTYNLRLTWNAVSGATNYPVRIDGPGAATNAQSTVGAYTSITGFGVVGDPAPTGTSYTFTGIPTGGSYQYWGHAWSSTGGWSTHTKRSVSCPIPAAVNGMCGPAATNYASGATAYSGALCSAGTASPASPAFPAQGGSSSWQCLGSGGGTTASCTATRSAAAVTPPNPPIGLTATPGACDSGQVTLSWNAVSGATSYTLYRNGSQIYSGVSTSYTNSGLTLDSSYTYTVSVTTGAGTSNQSSGVSGTAPSCAPVGTAPATPTSFTANNGACATGRISLNWSDVLDATSYQLQRSVSSTGSFATIYNGVSSAYSDTGLSPDTIYYYRVRATNDYGNSAYTSVISEISPAATCPPPPATPTGLSGTPGACSTNNINVRWDVVPGATQYNLYRNGSRVYTGSNPSRTDNDRRDIVPGTSHTYTVNAENGGGTSALSSPITVSAPAACERADLVSEGLSVTGTFEEGQPLSLSAAVRNSGSVAAGAFSDNFTYQWGRTDGTWNPITTIGKSGLAAGSTSPDSGSFTPTQSGRLYIQHCVDSNRQIDEGSNENPNCTVSSAYTIAADSSVGCSSGTVTNCRVPNGTDGQNVTGSCATGYQGSCNYTCDNGTWSTPGSNSCSGPSILTYRVCTIATGVCTDAPGTHVAATGTPLRIEWTSNADNCQRVTGPADFTTGNLASGSDDIIASSVSNVTTTYSILCRYGNNNTSAAQRTLYVFTAQPGPELIVPRTVRQGSSARIEWDTNNGNEGFCTLRDDSGTNYSLSNGTGDAETGYREIAIHGRTTFTLTCGGQSAVRTAEIIPATWES